MPPGLLSPHAMCCLSFPSCKIRLVRLSFDSVVLRSDKIMKAKCSTHCLADRKDSVNGGYPPSTLSSYDRSYVKGRWRPPVLSPKTISVHGSCLSLEEKSLGKFCPALFLEAKLVPLFLSPSFVESS